VVGIGPGAREHMSFRALEVIKNSNTIVGYKLYIELVQDIVGDKHIIASQMRKEVERVNIAIQEVLKGNVVSIISSGDSGVYGMAGLALEAIHQENRNIPLEIVPGIPAANAAAALLGAPLMNDYAVISLSDLLTPWEIIQKRVIHAAEADFVIVFYNPKSVKRNWQFGEAIKIILKYRAANTPAGVVKNATREGESVIVTSLDAIKQYEIDMMSIIIIGNSSSFIFQNHIVTKRGYQL